MIPTHRPIEKTWVRWCVLGPATGFGLGLIRPAPGTWGSLLGLVLGYFVLQWPTWMGALFLGTLALILSPLLTRAQSHWGEGDCQKIVLDEVIGQAIACLGLRAAFLNMESLEPSTFWMLFAGSFVIFRLLDITKPFPARIFDRMKTGFGIMMDDVVAGLYAALMIRAITRILLARVPVDLN
jgi:phosphatidylglycerophosphatase A